MLFSVRQVDGFEVEILAINLFDEQLDTLEYIC
jgi:hypothetical protein